MRVLAAHILEHALRRGALAVVLRRPVTLHYRLRRQGEDLALLGMHHHRTQHLVVVRDVPVLVVLLAAVLAVHARRGEIPRPVHREQVVPVQPGEPRKPLAALQLSEHALEHTAQLARVHLVESLAQRRVARRALNPVQSLQIRPHHLVGACIAVELKQRRILQPEHRTQAPTSDNRSGGTCDADTGSSSLSKDLRTPRSSPGALNVFLNRRLAMWTHPSLEKSWPLC